MFLLDRLCKLHSSTFNERTSSEHDDDGSGGGGSGGGSGSMALCPPQ